MLFALGRSTLVRGTQSIENMLLPALLRHQRTSNGRPARTANRRTGRIVNRCIGWLIT